MSIAIGGGLNSVKDIYIGNKKVTKAYVGNEIIYRRKIWLMKDGNRMSNFTSYNQFKYGTSGYASVNFIPNQGMKILNTVTGYTAGTWTGIYLYLPTLFGKISKIYFDIESYYADDQYGGGISVITINPENQSGNLSPNVIRALASRIGQSGLFHDKGILDIEQYNDANYLTISTSGYANTNYIMVKELYLEK